jgi:hypothetical protein
LTLQSTSRAVQLQTFWVGKEIPDKLSPVLNRSRAKLNASGRASFGPGSKNQNLREKEKLSGMIL